MSTSSSNRTYTNCQSLFNKAQGIGSIGVAGGLTFDSFLFDSCTVAYNGVYPTTHFGIGIILDTAATVGSSLTNITVSNCTVYNNAGDGIVVRKVTDAWPGAATEYNGKVSIFKNRVYNNGNGGISVLRSVNGEIYQNTVFGNGTAGTLGGIWTGGCQNLQIRSNLVYNNTSNSYDGAGIFDDQYNLNTQVFDNRVFGQTHKDTTNPLFGGYGIAIYRTTNSIHYGNLVYNNNTNCFIGLTTQNCKIYNSSFFAPLYNSIWIWSNQNNANQIEIKNCIIESILADNATVGTQTISTNAISGTVQNVSPVSPITGSLGLDKYFRIKASSPCIATGLFLGLFSDLTKSSYQNPPSIGAYEYMRPRAALTQVRTFR